MDAVDASNPTRSSAAQTTQSEGSQQLKPRISPVRRTVLYVLLCLSMFFDSFNLSALFAAIPLLHVHYSLSEREAGWVMSAFQLTYASFLLISGRISDVYHPKPVFIVGVSTLGLFCLDAGFVSTKIGFARSAESAPAALTIPSSLALIVKLFPDPKERSRAIGIWGGVGGVGNGRRGSVISALFVLLATYHWIFWFITIMALPTALLLFLLISNDDDDDGKHLQCHKQKLKNLDLIGVTLLTAALILFIYSVTTATGAGWGTVQVLAPLIISVFMVAAFFIWEAKVPTERASVPPQTWFVPNVAVLFGVSLIPYFWWNTAITISSNLGQDVFGWSVLKSAVHIFPIGVTALAVWFTGPLTRYLSPKWFITLGNILLIVARILFCFADAPDKYWRFGFTGLGIGSAGAMLAYTHSSIAMLAWTPPEMAGMVGAIFNCGCQLGAAVGLAVDLSIETSVEQRHGGYTGFSGRRAAFYWQIAAVAIEGLAVLIFYNTEKSAGRSDSDAVAEGEKTRSEETLRGNRKGDALEKEAQMVVCIDEPINDASV